MGSVRAVLKDMACSDQEVVQVTAFCKTAEVERVFDTMRCDLTWPWLAVICDICRDDLLFEIDASACPGEKVC